MTAALRLLDAALGVAEAMITAARDRLRERADLPSRPTYAQGYLDALAYVGARDPATPPAGPCVSVTYTRSATPTSLTTMARASGNVNIAYERRIGPRWRVWTAMLGHYLSDHNLASWRVTAWMQGRWNPHRTRFVIVGDDAPPRSVRLGQWLADYCLAPRRVSEWLARNWHPAD
jgi:hypothetical protein